MRRLVIDRFEGDYALCEYTDTRETIDIKKSLLPQEAKEGSTITLENDVYSLDIQDTEARRKAMAEKLKRIFD